MNAKSSLSPSGRPRRIIPPALASLIIASAGVLVVWMTIPPGATTSSVAVERPVSESRKRTDSSTSVPSEDTRRPFTSPARPSEAVASEPGDGPTGTAPPALVGSVVNSDSRPVSRALVKLARTDASGLRNATTRTDASGEFVVKNLDPGTWRVAVSAVGYRPQTIPLEVPHASPVEFVLEDDPGLEVSVSDGLGTPVAGARVTLRARSNFLPGRRSGVTTTAGKVTLSGILASGPEWRGQLTVKHDDYLPLEQFITAEDLERGRLQLMLEEGGELRVRIVSSDGQPVSGALVTSFQRDAEDAARLRSIANGEVHFRNLRPGDYTVTATTNRAGQAIVEEISVAAGPDPNVREIPLVRGSGRLTVRAVTDDGRALALCAVRLKPASDSNRTGKRDARLEGVTDENGECRFEALSATHYDVEIGGGKYTRDQRTAVAADGREVVLNVDRPGSIVGRVALANVTGAYAIRISRPPSADGAVSSYERIVRFSATRRAFTLRYVPRGTYTLDLLVDGKTVATVEAVEVLPGEKTAGVTFGGGDS